MYTAFAEYDTPSHLLLAFLERGLMEASTR